MKGFIKPFEPRIAHFILSAVKWVVKLLTVNENTTYSTCESTSHFEEHPLVLFTIWMDACVFYILQSGFFFFKKGKLCKIGRAASPTSKYQFLLLIFLHKYLKI